MQTSLALQSAKKLLKKDGRTLASQIKNNETIEKYYVATYQKGGEQIALNSEAVSEINFRFLVL